MIDVDQLDLARDRFLQPAAQGASLTTARRISGPAVSGFEILGEALSH